MISFTVYGKPQPQGSSSAFIKSGRVIVTSANPKLKGWRDLVAMEAFKAEPGCILITGPVSIGLKFTFKRPKSAPKERIECTTKPDLDKLSRAILDALKGILYVDDSQVVEFSHLSKGYGECEGVWIEVREK